MASTEKEPQKRGPKKIPISVEEVGKLAALKCTYADAASWFDVSLSTFKRRMDDPELEELREAWDFGQGKGNVSLRRNQFKLSEKNATMAIFLGKQWLGQRDIHVNEVTGAGGGPIGVSVARETFRSRILGMRDRREPGRDDGDAER